MADEDRAVARDPVSEQPEKVAMLTENALEILKHRYLRKGPDNQTIETVDEMFHRVASCIAGAEGESSSNMESVFFDLMRNLRFLPNSPTFTGAGTPLGQLAACFVLPISDDIGREDDGIFQTLRNAALIQQSGGGTGFSFSRLRPDGSLVHRSEGRATGPVGFMRVFDCASAIISQGGVRRGANMAVLNVNHPDIFNFICCKASEGTITNFNISIGVTDKFMRAVKEDSTIELVSPEDNKVWKIVPAREVFDAIVDAAYRNGEPGMVFLDTANRGNPCPHLGDYEGVNPCGEQFLLPYENCCLGSINLAQHINNSNKVVDWEKLQSTIELATRFLDDVITVNRYIPSVPKIKEAALRSRRVGVGIMGLSDMLYVLRVPYDKDEGRELAGQVMEFIRFHAMHTSIQLSREREPFPAIKGSVYDPDNISWTPPQPITPFRRLEKWGRPSLDWGIIVDSIKQHGIRNATLTTIAPTGTVASIAGCEGYGCEPVYRLAYVRHVKEDGKEIDLEYRSSLFIRAMETAGFDTITRESIMKEIKATGGSCQGVNSIPHEISTIFKVSNDLSAEEHVLMQATLQAFVDASISKTVNLRAAAARDEVAKAFILAWEQGCKGVTIYVAGSRRKVVLETETTQNKLQTMSSVDVQPRPSCLKGKTYRMTTPQGTAYMTVNSDDSDEPFEVFINIGKAGASITALAEAIGRLISLILRIPLQLSKTDRLKHVIRQLRDIGGGLSLGFGRGRTLSLPDSVAQKLAEHLGISDTAKATANEQMSKETRQEVVPPIGDLCPKCGQMTFVAEEGCRHCYNTSCGFYEVC